MTIKFDDTSYNAWRTMVIAKFRAEYAPYDQMPEFDRGMADAANENLKTYTTPIEYGGGVKAQAWDRGFECAMRLSRVFHNT